jgi:predicted helicase
MIGEGNLVLLTPKVKTTSIFNHALVSRVPAEKKSCSHDRATQMFPLFDKRSGRSLGATATGLNLSDQYMADFRRTLTKNLPADQVSGQAVFHYIYAVLFSPTYRRLFGSLLKDDYARIPFVSDASLFVLLSQMGSDLVALHLLEEDYPDATWNQHGGKSKSPFADDRLHLVGKTGDLLVDAGFPKFSDRTVWLNGSQGIKPVAEEVWDFLLGGYQVCEKWLKDRRGESLAAEELRRYSRIITALTRTLVLMDEIDGAIRKRGGLDGIPWSQE